MSQIPEDCVVKIEQYEPFSRVSIKPKMQEESFKNFCIKMGWSYVITPKEMIGKGFLTTSTLMYQSESEDKVYFYSR